MTEPNERDKAEKIIAEDGTEYIVLPSDYKLANKLHEMWEDYSDDVDENALRIAAYRLELTADHESKFCETLNGMLGNRQDGIGFSIDTGRAMAIIGEYVSRVNKARSDEWDATTIKFHKRIAELDGYLANSRAEVERLREALIAVGRKIRRREHAQGAPLDEGDIIREALASVPIDSPTKL